MAQPTSHWGESRLKLSSGGLRRGAEKQISKVNCENAFDLFDWWNKDVLGFVIFSHWASRDPVVGSGEAGGHDV